MAKSFVKIFLICLVLFTLILIPAIRIVSDVNVFESDGGVELEEDLNVLVDPDSPFFDAFADSKRINLLMVGVNDNLTDTIMLVSWDMDNNGVDVISVPRDTYYERSGYTSAYQKKINAAYSSDDGILATAECVSDVLMGIPINYYAIVDYDSVREIVDGVGGVPINIPEAMKYSDPYDDPPLQIDLPAGQQTLDGDDAVKYLRYRKGYVNGDIGRVEAQQEFLKSLFRQCVEHGVTKSAKLIASNVKSDVTLGAVSKYALEAIGLKSDSIHTYLLPGEGKYIGNVSYYVQDEEKTKDMLKKIYDVTSSDDESGSDTNSSAE